MSRYVSRGDNWTEVWLIMLFSPFILMSIVLLGYVIYGILYVVAYMLPIAIVLYIGYVVGKYLINKFK